VLYEGYYAEEVVLYKGYYAEEVVLYEGYYTGRGCLIRVVLLNSLFLVVI
jgi:hypothetical protein